MSDMPGLYDLTNEYFGATPLRRKEIEAEVAERFPFVKGMPTRPGMVYLEVAPEYWKWAPTGIGLRYLDNDGNIIEDQEVDLFSGPFERLKDDAFAHPAADFMRLNFALMFWPRNWGNAFYAEVFGSFRLRDKVKFNGVGVEI